MLLAAACTATVPVTSDPGSSNTGGGTGTGTSGTAAATVTAESTLATALFPQCKQICTWMLVCPDVAQSCTCTGTVAAGGATATVNTSSCDCQSSFKTLDECVSSCSSSIGEHYLFKGETCADLGIGLLDCYSKLTCANVTSGQDDPCGESAARSLCSRSTNDVPTSPTTSGPSAAVGGSAGTAPATTGPAAGGAAAVSVTCSSGTGMGTAPVSGSAGPQPNQLLCETASSNCTDGHEYRVSCGTTQDLVVMCQCIFDNHAQVSFQDDALLSSDPSKAACNNTATLNAKCGWSLTDTTSSGSTIVQ
jgi:hypothetical protein